MAARGAGARKRRTARRAHLARQRQAVRPDSLSTDVETAVKTRSATRLQGAGIEFAASGSTSLALGDRTAKWDASAADKAVRTWAGATDKPNAKYATAFFFKDGDGAKFGDFKLGFAEPVGGKLTANWGGLTAVAGALQGARGGVEIPDADKAAIKTKVEGYYAKAAKQYKDDGIKAPWKASDEASIQFATERGLDIFYAADGEPTNDEGRYVGVGGDFNPVELVTVQKSAAAQALAYAELGPDVDSAILAVAALVWEEAFSEGAPTEITAAAGDLVWDDEDGFMDLMDDLNQLLNAGGYGWRVIDIALSADKAIVCCYSGAGLAKMAGDEPVGDYDSESDGPGYFLVPFKIGDDKEPVLSDQAKWVPVEEGWVKSAATLAERIAEGFAVMAVCAGCSHPAGMHGGDDNTGSCSSSGCDCSAYEAKSSSSVREIVFSGVALDEVAAELAGRSDVDYDTIRLQLEEFTVHFADSVADTIPDAHQPGERMPRRRPSPGAPATPVPDDEMAGPVPVAWSAILAPEGKLTSDGRAFAPGSITWPRLDDGPLALMAMTVTSEGGHVGAELCGQIQKIWRDEAAGLIRASGVFDTGEYGTEIARLVDDRTLRGVSVDLAVQKWDRSPKADWFDESGEWAPKDDADRTPVSPIDLLYGEDLISVVLGAEIGMTTVCPFPAFGEAQIGVGESLVAAAQSEMCWTVTQDAGMALQAPAGASLSASAGPADGTADDDCGCGTTALTASAAGLVPEKPPAAWFENPELDAPTALMVDDEGRISGHAAVWGVCHIGLPGQCRTAPHTNTDYAYFHLGEVLCDDDERVACGQITLDTGHAARGLDYRDATAHYDDTGTVVAHVRVGEDEHGIWVAGALQPDAPEDKVRLLRGAKLSGDWRKIEGNLELVALLTVNVPGFPVPRASAQIVASAAGGEAEVQSLIAAGIPFFDEELSAEELEQFAALRAHAEFAALADQAA